MRAPVRVGFWRPNPDGAVGERLGQGLLAELLSPLLVFELAPCSQTFATSLTRRGTNASARCCCRTSKTVGFRREAQFGYSLCRICNRQNGTADFSDGVYEWPEGFGHYIREHHVRPPQQFVRHVIHRTMHRSTS